MRLHSRVRTVLRKYEKTLFETKSKHNYNDRLYAFYLLIFPAMEWMKPTYSNLGLEEDEIDSEIFLLIAGLFKGYKRDKSSIVPYVENSIKFQLSKSIRQLSKGKLEVPSGLLQEETGIYEINESYYWNYNSILLEKKYIRKYFTRSENYLIYRIIDSDYDKLNNRSLAQSIGISRENLRSRLDDLKKKYE